MEGAPGIVVSVAVVAVGGAQILTALVDGSAVMVGGDVWCLTFDPPSTRN